jgi:hypothetical protein
MNAGVVRRNRHGQALDRALTLDANPTRRYRGVVTPSPDSQEFHDHERVEGRANALSDKESRASGE